MCIAILNNSETLTFDVIKNSFDNNRDGASFTFINSENRLQVVKELNFDKVKDFYNSYVSTRISTDKPIMLHFRIGTSGAKNEANLHPFFINQSLALVHNGIIDIPEPDSRFNDSYHFASFCRKLKKHERLLNINSFEFKVLENFIQSSKIIFLHNSGKYSIMNESLGHWDKSNNWFSNHTYEICDYYNVGGKTVKKSYGLYDNWWIDNYNYQSTSKSSEVVDIPINVNQFNKLDYSEKCKVIHLISGDDYEPSKSWFTIDNLHKLFGTTTLSELYEELTYGGI